MEKLKIKMDAILSRLALETKKEVAVNEIVTGAHPKCFPVTYLIYNKDQKPVLAVLTMGVNQRKSMPVKGTIDTLAGAGIATLRFYKEFPNEEEYVKTRIIQALDE